MHYNLMNAKNRDELIDGMFTIVDEIGEWAKAVHWNYEDEDYDKDSLTVYRYEPIAITSEAYYRSFDLKKWCGFYVIQNYFAFKKVRQRLLNCMFTSFRDAIERVEEEERRYIEEINQNKQPKPGAIESLSLTNQIAIYDVKKKLQEAFGDKLD